MRFLGGASDPRVEEPTMAEERDGVRLTGADAFGIARDPELAVHLVNAARTRFFRGKDEKAFLEWSDLLLETHGLLPPGPVHERWFREHLVWHWAVRAHRNLPRHEIDRSAEEASTEFGDCDHVLEQVEIWLHAEPARVEPIRGFVSFKR